MLGTCLSCLQTTHVHHHHFPKTRRYGDFTVPLCLECHDRAHRAHPVVLDRLEQRAPAYWVGTGEWEDVAGLYWAWVGRRQFMRATAGGSENGEDHAK